MSPRCRKDAKRVSRTRRPQRQQVPSYPTTGKHLLKRRTQLHRGWSSKGGWIISPQDRERLYLFQNITGHRTWTTRRWRSKTTQTRWVPRKYPQRSYNSDRAKFRRGWLPCIWDSKYSRTRSRAPRSNQEPNHQKRRTFRRWQKEHSRTMDCTKRQHWPSNTDRNNNNRETNWSKNEWQHL